MHLADRPARLQHARKPFDDAEGAPGDLLRDRPQVRHRQHLVRLRQAGDRADQLQFRGERPLHDGRPRTTTSPTRVDVANKLLDEAGYPRKADGMRFEIVHDMTPYGEEWQRYGDTSSRRSARSASRSTCATRTFRRGCGASTPTTTSSSRRTGSCTLPDPVLGVAPHYGRRTIRPGTAFVNSSGWHAAEDRSADGGGGRRDRPAKRAALYHEFQKLIVEAAPVIWVTELHFMTVYDSKFKNLICQPARHVHVVQQGLARSVGLALQPEHVARTRRRPWKLDPGGALRYVASAARAGRADDARHRRR